MKQLVKLNLHHVMLFIMSMAFALYIAFLLFHSEVAALNNAAFGELKYHQLVKIATCCIMNGVLFVMWPYVMFQKFPKTGDCLWGMGRWTWVLVGNFTVADMLISSALVQIKDKFACNHMMSFQYYVDRGVVDLYSFSYTGALLCCAMLVSWWKLRSDCSVRDRVESSGLLFACLYMVAGLLAAVLAVFDI